MKIKRLEISGFKSFVDRTVLDFQRGVTAIVGPNGCGKSNIVDAIRWVMGEQSAKNLRGKNMEDVIFGGSVARKPLGMAEVSLVFSTEDGRVPSKYLDFSEIQVTRRLFRSGESEYLLNKTSCRLLDIAELFMDTGAGARAYSIIEQGKIGMILNSKPEERRFLIEEAAGVVKYKSRKQLALKKIEITRQNLVRIGDIVAEIRRQMNALQRQAKKAAKFRELREEAREIDLLFAASKYSRVGDEKKQVEDQLVCMNAALENLQTELETGELALEGQKIALLEKEKVLAASQEKLYLTKSEIQGAENRREFQKKELENLERQQERFTADRNNLQRQLLEAEAELRNLEEFRESLASLLQGEGEDLVNAERDLEEVIRHEKDVAGSLEEIRRALLAVLAEIAQFNNQHSTAARRLTVVVETVARNAREMLALKEKLAEADRRKGELELTLAALVGQKDGLADELSVLKSRENQLKERFAEVVRKLQEKRDELNKKGSRLHSLQELEAQFAGYGQGVRSLFLTERFKGKFKGLLADFVEVEEKYELALETVLAEKLQYVLCDNHPDVLSAIAYLKETTGGRCSFIMEGLQVPEVQAAPQGLPLLTDKVEITDSCADLLIPLLANVCIADSLETAFTLCRQFPRMTFVTEQGDVVDNGGIIHGGSTDAAQQGLVHKKREIKLLAAEVAALSQQVQDLEQLRRQMDKELATVDEELRNCRQGLHQMEIQLLNNDKDLQRAREECQRIDERLAIKGIEDDQIQEEKDTLEEEIAHSDRQRSAREGKKSELEKEVALLHEMLAKKKLEIDTARDKVTGLKVRAAAHAEKRESNLRAIRRVTELIQELRTRNATCGAEFAKGARDKDMLAAALAGNEENLGLILARYGEEERQLLAIREKFDTEAGQVNAAEIRLKELRSNAEQHGKSLADKKIKASELSLMLQHLEDSLLNKYRVDITEILPTYADLAFDEPERQRRLEELQRLIDEMGEVNLMAIEEFKELEERFDFLSAQKSDLEESLQSLQQAIQRINRTTRKRFQETFLLVNAKFQEIFPRLFCGGFAELKLTNEEDLLETGIDIIVQPPGKKLQNITLLSGGEKALTAVALMFSIFLIKPTPFCLLDEVDAPLDEANIRRFNEMIRELSDTSQFIMITHNKTSMSGADCLYGVTMEDPGVSRLVSVKLN
jgi:chromosome segregation protein